MKILYKDKFAYIFDEDKEITRLDESTAFLLKLKEGTFKVKEVKADEKGFWVERNYDGYEHIDNAVIYSERPPHGFIRYFCWDLFSSTTGIDLEPNEFGKYALTK